MIELLGYVAMVISWFGLYFCGKYRFGWMISVLVWLLWFPYGLLKDSVPVMINTTVFAAVSFWNWAKWDERNKKEDNANF